MVEIGHSLREARERLGLTLEEAERSTRIRAHHLRALEAGELEALPSAVHGRGFLKNYAEFLGLDADALLLQYANALHARRPRLKASEAELEPRLRRSVRVISRRPRWLSADLFVAAGITLAVMVVLVWGVGRVMAAVGEQTRAAGGTAPPPTSSPTPTLTPVLLAASELPTLEATAGEPSPIPTLPVLSLGAGGVNLRLVVEGSAWLRVVVDGREAFRGRVSPGQLLEYQAEQAIEVATGNGAGLHAFYNGEDQGTLGDLGEVIVRLWTLEGVVTPTATQTRTPTVTPRVTPTPSPTATVAPAPGG
ncbi:MAG: RodZ domain-containing protein [Chloroflexota bacterium]